MVLWIKNIHHPLLIFFKILRLPVGVIAQQFTGHCKLIAVETGSQEYVGVAAQLFAGSSPGIQDLNGFIGIGIIAFDLPAKS